MAFFFEWPKKQAESEKKQETTPIIKPEGEEILSEGHVHEFLDREHRVHHYVDDEKGYDIAAIGKDSAYLEEEIKKLEAAGYVKKSDGEKSVVFVKESKNLHAAHIPGQTRSDNDFAQPSL
jgi:hypothetical protein